MAGRNLPDNPVRNPQAQVLGCSRRRCPLLFDLHTHSNASDGILSPQALVSRAKDNGVSHLALTDHDTTAGLVEARQAANDCGLELITGIEFSTQWQGLGVHIVGLNMKTDSSALGEAIERQKTARTERGEEIGRRLAKAGIPDAWHGAQALAGQDGVVGRPHFAQFMVNQGHVTSINSAFKKYLGAGKIGDVKQLWLTIPEAVAAITASGGNAVLAHPGKYKMTRTKLRRLTQVFADAGGQAMEVVSGNQPANETRALADIARQFQLHASCGSDFHSPAQAWQDVGRYSPLPQDLAPVWALW